MERGVLECALKRCWKDTSVRRVLSVESSPAVGKDVNYLSVVSRLKVKVVLANGRVANRSLILKETKLTDQHVVDTTRKYNVFKIETMVYKTVLQEMEFIMEEYHDTGGILWCNLVHHVPYTCLVLEDLKASGFSMMKRGDSLDLEHTLMAVNALGRFHGLCKVLEERGVVCKDDYKPWFVFNSLTMHKSMVRSMMAAVRGIKKYWSPPWSPVVSKINITEEELHEKMRSMEAHEENKFKVLNHGDCHKNNFMFRHDWRDRPTEIRFLDFQLLHHGSPCCDLTYMLYLGPDPFVRRSNYDLILQTYHESLLSTLDGYSFGGSRPELEEIRGLMDKYSFFGMYMFITSYAGSSTAEPDDELFVPGRTLAQGEEDHGSEIYDNEKLEEAMGPDLRHFMEKEVLECALKRCWKESSVSHVLSVDSSPAVGKNENFLSTVSRLTVKVVLENGRLSNRSLILKETKTTDIHMYNTVLKEMENMMEEFEDTDGILWCPLVHHIPYTCLVLEDLKASGFITLKKGSFLGLDHTLMTVNALGRYHGMCKVLEERGIVSKDNYKDWFMFNDFKMHQFWVWNMIATIQGIKKYWNPAWCPIVNKIELTENGLHEKMKQMSHIDENKFKVLNHGDCHMYNVMYKHNWNNQPIDLRLLDFQLPHYASPCCDLTYILYLSSDVLIRRNNYNLILKTYHESLLRTLEKYNFGGNRPTMQEILDLMDKYLFLGLFLFISAYAALLMGGKSDDLYDADKLMATAGKEGYDLEIYNSKTLEEAMGPDIVRFVETFF